jgi:calcium-dependent protein kinase
VTMSVHLKEIDSDEILSQAFSVFDKNQNGYIEFDELRETLVDDKHGTNNDQVIKDIIFDADLDKVIILSLILLLKYILTRNDI